MSIAGQPLRFQLDQRAGGTAICRIEFEHRTQHVAAGGSHSEQPGSAQTAEEGADFGANSPFEPEFDRVRSPERFGGLVGHSPPREGFYRLIESSDRTVARE